MTIILDNISKAYDGKKVLDNFRVEIEWGKCYAFIGPAGSGKSTILKIFMGDEQPDSGKVSRMGDYKYPTLHTAYVSQDGLLNPKKNAVWNVCKAHRWTSKTGATKSLLQFLSEDKLAVPVSDLTDVERRYVEIVKASFMTADFVVMDEPFKGMNDQERKAAYDFIQDFRGSRPLLISSTDELDLKFDKVMHL